MDNYAQFEGEKMAWGDLQKGLSAFFAPNELEWRVQSSGFNGEYPWVMVLAYVNNRAIEGRLDRVCGVGGWQNIFRELQSGGYQCGIGITVGRDVWTWKWDAADKTHVEPVKGGHSSAMKRAAQQWGIGRYLYYFPVSFADIHIAAQGERVQDGWKSAYVKVDKNDKYGIKCYWKIPDVPAKFLPEAEIQENDIPY